MVRGNWLILIKLIILGICCLISACSINQEIQTPGTGNLPDSPAGHQPTNTPADPGQSIEAATLFTTGFDNEYPLGIDADYGNWEIRTLEEGNRIFCNLPSDDWTSFTLGKYLWQDFAIELSILMDSEYQDQFAEIYIRINPEMDGYRAGIGNHDWATIGYYPPPTNLADQGVNLPPGEWFKVRIHAYSERIDYYLNDHLVISLTDERRHAGAIGVGASSGTQVCIDDLHVWGLDSSGDPHLADNELVIEPYDGTTYVIEEKIADRKSIPVFFPWSGDCESDSEFYFDCDSEETPYGLVWTASGINQDIESLDIHVSPTQSVFMRSDPDTLYLISEEWHYWNTGWRYLSQESKFYLEETFQHHVDSEYGDTKVINFLHPDWPDFLAQKLSRFKEAGYDGVMLDWWHDWAGNGRPEEIVAQARLEIIQAIREEVGDDFILMGNVGWSIDDPTTPYLSGVFLELWNPDPSSPYPLVYADEDQSVWDPSIERMEDLLLYWDKNLSWPAVLAFEPWKVTREDYIQDRYSDENFQYARLFSAMAVVIPEHGYILYADHNDDWDGGDHQHAYYAFYRTDLGKPTSSMVDVTEGVAYKEFEKGIVIYNRTNQKARVDLPDGSSVLIDPLTGLILTN